MEIIAKTENGFILKAHKDEIARLIGHYGYNSIPDSGYNRSRLEIGDNIKVNGMYDQLYRLARISGEAEQAKKTLAAALELFSIVDPVVKKIIEEPTQQETENGK